MTREQIESISIGQTGLYLWNKRLAVVSVEPVQFVLRGREKGKAFRYVRVTSETGNATIGFIVREDTEETLRGRRAYEADLMARPFYHDGTRRPTWDMVGEVARMSWEEFPRGR